MSEHASNGHPAALIMTRQQRSHVLLVLSNATAGAEKGFSDWYEGPAKKAVLGHVDVLKASHFAKDDIDVTGGMFLSPPYRYLAIYELCVDGAEQAEDAVNAISTLYKAAGCADTSANWLYFPAGEQVGISAPDSPGVTVAFTNSLPGQEDAFREWYTTRHIRHALNIPALTSGQCFERTGFQLPGGAEAQYQMIAIYEQTGTTQSIIDSFHALSPETIAFPALDLSRFAEVAYRRLA